MKTHISTRGKGLAFLMALLLLFGMIQAVPLAEEDVVTKTEHSYDIAVVFDNSGSMYDDASWCRAKYAMEIFASMLNYDNGDRLRIYPMWQVTTDGSQPETGGSYAPFAVQSKADIDKISKMFTVYPSNTPFEPVDEAHADLKKSAATDKWLIVMTDGLFNADKRGQSGPAFSDSKLRSQLLKKATNGIHVQYLGFGQAASLKADAGKQFYTKKSTANSLKNDLIEICNAIFQRSALPGSYLKGKKLTLDLSMRNLIVFAQGKGAKITGLKDKAGQPVGVTLDSGQRKYSTIKANDYKNAPVDDKLAGQVVTFAACPQGEYTLDYTGADEIQIFYEPDVAVNVTLTDAEGKVVDGKEGEIVTGEYTVHSKIVDKKTGEDVTAHPLMGNDVQLVTKVKTSEEGDYTAYENGAKINLQPDSSTDILVEGTYLKDYKITSRGNKELEWLNNITVSPPAVAFHVEAKVEQLASRYCVFERKDWQPITVTFTLDGQPLTDEQMQALAIDVAASDDLPHRVETVSGQSALRIYPGEDQKGNPVDIEKGRYTIDIKAEHTDEYGRKVPAGDGVKFNVTMLPTWLVSLIWLGVLVALFALIRFIRSRKAFPKKVWFVPDGGGDVPVQLDVKSGQFSLNDYITGTTARVTDLARSGKPSAAFMLTLSPPSSKVISMVSIGSGRRFVYNSTLKGYVKENTPSRETIDFSKMPFQIDDGTRISWIETKKGLKVTKGGVIRINRL